MVHVEVSLFSIFLSVLFFLLVVHNLKFPRCDRPSLRLQPNSKHFYWEFGRVWPSKILFILSHFILKQIFQSFIRITFGQKIFWYGFDFINPETFFIPHSAVTLLGNPPHQYHGLSSGLWWQISPLVYSWFMALAFKLRIVLIWYRH